MDPPSPDPGPTNNSSSSPSLSPSTSPSARNVGPTAFPRSGPASPSPSSDVGPAGNITPSLDPSPEDGNAVGPNTITIHAVGGGPTAEPAKEIPSPTTTKLPPPSSPDAGPTEAPGPGAGPTTAEINPIKPTASATTSEAELSLVKIPPPPAPMSKVPIPDAGPTAAVALTADVGPTPIKTKSIQMTTTTTTTTTAPPTEKGYSPEKFPPPPSPMTDLPLSDLAPAAGTTNDDIPCPHADLEVVRKLAQFLLPGLATAAVDSTTGDPFRSPATVAVDLRRDLTDHITLRSDSLVPQSLALLAADPTLDGLPDLNDPLDLLSHLIEEFAASKRNLIGRVSGWILSDSREDKIDDFVQEMELTNFWKLDLRESLADSILKNLDYKNEFHCSMRFNSEEELDIHKKDCSFRPVSCKNEGCKVKYCIKHKDQHDEACPYKVLDCEQRCRERIMRREMDRHCITVCKMKAMNCPFYHLGCHTSFPQSQLREHCGECVATHLVRVMGVKNEEGLGEEELKARAENMEKSQFRDELAGAFDVRRLTLAIKNVEAKMKKQQGPAQLQA